MPLPDRAVLDDPLLERAHGSGLEPARPDAADLLRAHEAAALQHVEVLHHGRQGHVQRRGELAHGGRAARQADDHRAAALVGERVEGPVELRCVGGRHGPHRSAHLGKYLSIPLCSGDRASPAGAAIIATVLGAVTANPEPPGSRGVPAGRSPTRTARRRLHRLARPA